MKTWICRTLTLVPVVALLAGPFAAEAMQPLANLKTVYGRTYQDCHILQKDPDGVYISHSKGMAKLLYVDLEEKDRTALGYDPEKEAAYYKGRAEKRAKQQMQTMEYRNAFMREQAMLAAEMDRMAAANYNNNVGYAPPTYDSTLPLLASWTTGNPFLPYNYGVAYGGGFSPYANGYGRNGCGPNGFNTTTVQGPVGNCQPNFYNLRSVPGRVTRQAPNVPFATPPLTGSVPALAPVSRQTARPAPIAGRAAVGGAAAHR